MPTQKRTHSREELTRAARRVRLWRAENRMSQREFSRLAGLSNNAFHAFESGDRQTRSETLDKVSAITGLSIDALVGPAERAFAYHFDERVANLTPYTIEMALEYQIADTATKKKIDDLLELHKKSRQPIGRESSAKTTNDVASSEEDFRGRPNGPPGPKTGTDGPR
jgi:transcriptional regulator with XRE-family HTH domain